MSKILDLEQHPAIQTAAQVDKIVRPLRDAMMIKHFRYLKLYHDGSRVLLSNYPDCTRFTYNNERYKKMWFDGEFPEYLKEGSYAWNITRLNDDSTEEEKFEQEINHLLGLYHGITFVIPGIGYNEIFSFDTEHSAVYSVGEEWFFRFILYFKQEARKLIASAEHERILISPPSSASEIKLNDHHLVIQEFLKNTEINRYYLKGEYADVYLTAKEAECIYWMIHGKTAEEIATICHTRHRTVQCHLENIRKKLCCYKQTQVAKIIIESGVFGVIDQIFNRSLRFS